MSDHWVDWHEQYRDPTSPLNDRLASVRSRLAQVLDGAPGPREVLSLCAGDGRDVVPVLADLGRGGVRHRATLVELSADLAERARASARASSIDVEVVCADAGALATLGSVAPADVVMLCGIFGNVTDDDVRHTVAHAGALVRRGGTVIWTRHRRTPDLTPSIRRWFEQAGFEELAFDSPGPDAWSVGVHRNVAAAASVPSHRLFTFVR